MGLKLLFKARSDNDAAYKLFMFQNLWWWKLTPTFFPDVYFILHGISGWEEFPTVLGLISENDGMGKAVMLVWWERKKYQPRHKQESDVFVQCIGSWAGVWPCACMVISRNTRNSLNLVKNVFFVKEVVRSIQTTSSDLVQCNESPANSAAWNVMKKH